MGLRRISDKAFCAIGLLGIALAHLGCLAETPQRPNIVLVVLCTFRLDHTGFGGYDRPTTPFLDSLAAESTVFEQAFSASSWTKPSAASLYTGLTPNVHQMIDDYPIHRILQGDGEPPRALPDSVVTLPEVLQEAGYTTGSRINNVNAGEFFNLAQGYDDTVTEHRMWLSRIADDLQGFLARKPPEDPFFYMIFTLDAHAPYISDYHYFQQFYRGDSAVSEEAFQTFPYEFNDLMNEAVSSGEPIPEDLKRTYIDLYDASLASLDYRLSYLPKLLDEAGVADDTIVVITADHGESFFEPGRTGHRQTTHGFDLSEPLVRIPLMMSGPGIPKGRKVSSVVRSIDLFPTLAELAGAETPPILQGRSLLPLLTESNEPLPAVTAFSSRAVGTHHAVHDGRHKLHLQSDGSYRLYDTVQDPFEQWDIQDSAPHITRRLEAEMSRWLDHEAALRPIVGEAGSRELTPEMIEQLKSLGYL